MKSKYGFWKHWLNSLAGLTGLAGLVCLTGCKELTCDFSYSPTQPTAGQVVTFTNSSVGADDYSWSFGDNSTSTTANPTHIYRRPDTYTVTLTIIRNKTEKRTRTQHITVLDTIPTLACDSDTIYTFTPVKFYPKVYNTWKKNITYHWTVPAEAVLIAGKSLDSAAIVCYFTKPGQASQIGLTLQLNDEKPFAPNYTFTPVHKIGTSLIYATPQDTLEQFTYMLSNQRLFRVADAADAVGKSRIRAEQDTVYQYGGKKYTLTSVHDLLKKDTKGFQVDRLMAKIYAYGNDGLWVCNMLGENIVQLDATPIRAIKVDGDGNCLYWATDKGLFFHALLKTRDNKESFTHDTVTTIYKNINRISVNSNLH